MQVGKLYRFEGFGYKRSGLEGQLAVYLGKDFIHRDDGVTIENHRILKVGETNASIIDRGLLWHMAEVEV
jgi:hypothetical protein